MPSDISGLYVPLWQVSPWLYNAWINHNLTTQVVGQFKFDIAVISCAAIDSDGDLLEFDLQETGATQAIIAQARRVYVVADHTKYGRSAPGKIGSLRDVHTIFTDAALPANLMDRCDEWNTRVEITGGTQH